MLNDLRFQSSYFKTRNEILTDFYIPCMSNSKIYNRITGYFGSSVFLVLGEALVPFIKNNGHIQIICSPILKKEDINAIQEGYTEKLKSTIEVGIETIIDELSNAYPNSTLLLSKLITQGLLDIKLAVFCGNSQDYRLMHDKAGVFIDSEKNAVAFRGSINETFKGISEFGNSESFDVYTNWEDSKDSERVDLVIRQFENMWFDTEPGIKTIEFPDICIEKIKSFVSEKSLEELIDESSTELFGKKSKWYAESGVESRTIKKHQDNALENWDKSYRKGLFEMCTGSGKTFIALCAIRESVFEKGEIPIVLVPSKLLFKQWKEELDFVLGTKASILLVGADHALDTVKLSRYSNPSLTIPRCILSTYQRASKDDFLLSTHWGTHIFLVCDEVHNIGSEQNKKLLAQIVGARMGLSATPKRYFDEEGTQQIIDFFGGIILPKYSISNAIKDGVLCPYFYDINEIQLLISEQEDWNRLSKKINRKIAMKKDVEDIRKIKGIDKLLFERADIVKKAKNKILVAEKILSKYYKADQRWLVYLDDTNQVSQLMQVLNTHENLRGNVYEYHTNTENDLPQTLDYFEHNGAILLSINCLDEGVDIPSIDHAIILASSKNPRQYVQRRGRVLRTNKGKNFAYIYDCFVSPVLLDQDDCKNISIIKGEIARALAFSKNARNADVCMNKIQVIMNNNSIELEEGEYGENE